MTIPLIDRCIRPDWEVPDGIRALSTTREGGASVGSYASLNLGAHTDDDPGPWR
jgi:copper oxidase (laccase) domain-containing protein